MSARCRAVRSFWGNGEVDGARFPWLRAASEAWGGTHGAAGAAAGPASAPLGTHAPRASRGAPRSNGRRNACAAIAFTHRALLLPLPPLRYLYQELSRVPGVTIYGPSPQQAGGRGRASLAAFNVEGLHATDVSTLLDTAGVAVRSGHHCTQPLHQ